MKDFNLKIISKSVVAIKLCSLDDSSGSSIQAPEISTYGKLRFATITDAAGAAVHGVTPLSPGDQVVLTTSWDTTRYAHLVPANDILGFWTSAGGRVNIAPVGERVVVESGYFVSANSDYGCCAADLPRNCGLIEEVKLGAHSTLRSVSVGSRRYDELLHGVNRRCYINHTGSGDITVAMLGRRAMLFVPVTHVVGVDVAA